MGTADGIEVSTADTAAWEEAVSRFLQHQVVGISKKSGPLASLSVHARRLLAPEDASQAAVT